MTFLALVLASFLVARFLAVGIHEALGHGLFAIATGGLFYGVYVSPVTGFALVFVPEAAPAALHALVAMAGILVDLVAGVWIWRSYGRFQTFAGRLFALTALAAFLVYSFAYLAVGAWALPGGDPEQAVIVLGAPHLVFGFALLGVVWALVAGFLITRELTALVRPGGDLGREIAYLVLFWFPPLPLAAVPNAVLTALAPVALLAFLALLGVVGAAVALAGLRIRRTERTAPPAEGPSGRLAPVAVAALLVLPAWAFFGPTGETATNLLFGEPPLSAESAWANPQALNVRVELAANRDVALSFWMKGVPEPRSPMEARVIASYEDRADFDYWTDLATSLAPGVTNVTLWVLNGTPRIDGNGTAWVGGLTVGNPRVVDLAVADPAFQQLLREVTTNGSRTFVTITMFDPFRAGRFDCAECFLDEVNFTWPGSVVPPNPFVLVRDAASGGTPDRMAGFDGASGRFYVRFRNLAAEDAPSTYQVVLEAF